MTLQSRVGPRVQCLMEEEETTAVCAVAKDTPREGTRLVEAAIDSGAEESAAPPNVFLREVHASAMFIVGGAFKAAGGTRMPNFGQQQVRFRNGGGNVCGMGFQTADVESVFLIAASQLAAVGNRSAPGREIENIKTGRKMTLMRRFGIFFLPMCIATCALGFLRPRIWVTSPSAFCCPVRPE